ncbi:hypothetical protein HBH56_177530 [Parastagonospora nodorum]|nr:hypothetical protein HBH56_177530 [Parastagonospora nodorum]KAH3939625.1 hypothetical protein HBH53_232140 [Parastagonospora nodorum]KAH3957515.1 hypothetical protein HBH51_224110 [Parastagonospora nodorum]KAH4061398.1 hypothetical protein HBH50_220350 [Parastagonospora nodorum]KAH4079843.1 hypothetical protein HBH48_213840 [Parastagonospora nodorum]
MSNFSSWVVLAVVLASYYGTSTHVPLRMSIRTLKMRGTIRLLLEGPYYRGIKRLILKRPTEICAAKICASNYTPGEGFAHTVSAFWAAQFGKEDVKADLLHHALLHHSDNDLRPIVDSPTGNDAHFHKSLPTDLIKCPVDEASLAAPKLNKVPFPEIVVPRSLAFEDNGLDCVLRGPPSPKTFTVELKHFKPGRKYVLNSISDERAKTTIIADLQSDGDGVAHETGTHVSMRSTNIV